MARRIERDNPSTLPRSAKTRGLPKKVRGGQGVEAAKQRGCRRLPSRFPPGLYEIVAGDGVAVDNGPRSHDCDQPLYTLPSGSYVTVSEVVKVSEECLRRGRISGDRGADDKSGGGWISLQQTSTGRVWAQRVPCGTYVVRRPLDLTDAADLAKARSCSAGDEAGACAKGESRGKGTLLPDDHVEVVSVRYLPGDGGGQVLARLPTGEWISVVDTNKGFAWARPVQLGAYMTLADVTISHGAELHSRSLRQVRSGKYVNILETVVSPVS